MLSGVQLHVAADSVKPQVGGPQAKVTNPHGAISIPCQNCHTYVSWKPIRSNPEFNHDSTGYPLRGMHEKVACMQCHTNLVFKKVSTQCAECHADIHRRQFGANCESCHSVKGWQVNIQQIQNHQNRFPLVGAHALVECDQCHKNAAAGQFVGLSTACYSCHQQDFLTPVINHVALNFPTTCETCHTMNNFVSAKFDHLKYTGYALTGAHATLECTACHANNVFTGTSAQCYACHTSDYANSNNPPHVQLGLPRECGTCHSTTDWTNAKFDHNLYAHWPLTGKHAAVPCAQCHTNNSYVSTPTDCYSCHKGDFTGTTSPNHVTSGFPTDCSLCHTTSGWMPSSFNHSTVFPLTGAHATVACAQCHTNGNYTTVPKDCYSCHTADFTGTNNPSHVSANFPHTCDTCHTTTNWLNATFNHALYANYPLTGAHATLQCAQCHLNNNYTATATACYSCHAADFKGTTNPNHVTSGFPTTCETCHSTTAWIPSSFNHNNTGFPLTGAHVTVPCASCHTNGNYTTVPTDCYACHKADYTGTTAPPHATAGFPTTCVTCHSTTSWSSATFNHNTTSFPLTGAHVTVACATCHVNNNYTTLPTNCYGCHQKDFTGTTNPNHITSGFPTTCEQCHSTTSWTSATFNHNTTSFPLTGAHVTVPCASCHTNNNYSGSLPTACYGCHQKDFTGTTNPGHVAAGFPTDCTQCHSTATWLTSTFNHNTTSFPLTGFHATMQCAQCHTTPTSYNGSLPTTCYGCHQKDFTGTTNPAHVSGGFPTDCTQCHNTSSWTNAAFNHNNTSFPLTGAHVTVACASCHVNNNYSGTLPTTCYGCHQADYTGTTSPAHVAGGFPTNCTLCHSTINWTTSTFNHASVFPLTGAHATVLCASCHINNNYATVPTDCYSCHKADYAGTTNPNHAQVGFPTTCATCHSTTDWTGASFNHNTTTFPLTGAHVTVACATCHVNNNYTTLPTTCYGCHQKDFTGTTNPNHVASGFPTTCQQCHSTTSWTSATFNHNTTSFPLTGAHVTVPCASCHTNNNYSGTLPTACYGCHQADFTGTTNPNHVASGFPTTCQQCHSTTNWTSATFNHNTTSFPLTGAHVTVPCASCHTNNNYSGSLPTACYGCHTADFTGTTNPAHVSAGFPTDCTLCHSTTNWTTSTFNHASVFPLTGFHATVTCAQCHTNNNYTTLPTNCYGCHTADFTGTTNPSHVAAGFPTTCDTCHNTTAWVPVATFNHTTYANWPLTGFHATMQCAQCHTNNNYGNLSTACYGCHQADFTGTTNPAHVTAGFPTDCTICHSTTNWTTSTFNHATTSFPLTGFHATMQCVQCHTSATTYNGSLPTLCYGCHTADYNGTNNPAHAAAGFPTTCDTCHSTTNWTGATFNHNNTPFPLTGAHTAVACVLCHVNNVFAGTPTDCYSCHTADFTGTTNPNHATAGWPTTCTTCHTTTAWLPATLPASYHTFFPMNHGNANSVCATCHTNSSDYSVFTCTACHGNNNAANFNHPNVNGYVYNSVNCYACHKSGGGG
jgi:hypothetical protein